MNPSEQLRLIHPSAEYEEEIEAYRLEFIAHGGSMDGALSLLRLNSVSEWWEQVEAFSSSETCPKGFSPVTQFLYVRDHDRKVIGMINIKHHRTEDTAMFGHLGYSVCPSERRKGYATSMLRAVLPWCQKLGFEEVFVTCLIDNVGSRKAILNNGGLYESTIVLPGSGNELERYKIILGDSDGE